MPSPFTNLENRVWQTQSPTKQQRVLRVLLAVIRIITQSRIKLFATSLTYYTLLAIVPVLAVLFTLLKSFGIEQFLQTMVSDFLAPMGNAGDSVSEYLFAFINNAQAGYLGGIGLLFLLYSVFKLFSQIELSLNHLWFIEHSRRIKSQLFNYLSVIMLVVIFASLAIAINVLVHHDGLLNQWANLPLIAPAFTVLLKALSILATAFMLAILYSGAINTNVGFKAAFIGGLFCAILWLPLTAAFAKLISLSSSYSIIYSSFAGLVILLVWLNVAWLLFLSGGLMAYFVQFPALLKPYGTATLNPAELECYADRMINMIYQRFHAGEHSTSLKTLMTENHLSHRQVLMILTPFLQQNFIVSLGSANTDYLPAVGQNILTPEKVRETIRGKIRHDETHIGKPSLNATES